MNLISIKPGRNSRLVWLKFDNGHLLPLKIDDLVFLSITKNEAITPEKLVQINRSSLSFMLEEYALRQIAISPKIKSILLPKLKNYCLRVSQKFNYPTEIFPDLIDTTVKKLEDRGLLDTIDYARYFIKRHRKMSQAQINFSLKRLGIADISQLTIEISDKDKIRQIITKKYHNIDFSDYHAKNKIFSALARLGFTISDIKTTIDEYLKIR
jgi:SOS response regulatory protein OraA/RecX